MHIFIKNLMQTCISRIFCTHLGIHMRMSDIKKSIFEANMTMFTGEPRSACWAAFTGLEEGVKDMSGCVCEAARGQI